MAKKFGKFLLFSAVASAAAGAFCILKKKSAATADETEEFEDFDDFSEDLADDADEDQEAGDRSYVDLSADEAKENLEQAVSDTVEKTEEFFNDEK